MDSFYSNLAPGNVGTGMTAPIAPSATPPKWLQALSTPQSQLALRLLMASGRQAGPRRGLGEIFGTAVTGYQDDAQKHQLAQIQGELYKAQSAYARAHAQALLTPKPADPEKFGTPFEAVGPDKQPGMFVRGDQGTNRQIPGLAPFRPPAAPTQPVAPSYRDVLDPKDSTRLITVDGRLYKGGTVGDVGVIGVAGKEPGAAKANETRGTGKESVSSLISTLKDHYDQLNTGGGIVNTKEAWNVGNALQSSGIGQFGGRVFGTQNQSLRNQITQQRPLLLQAIRQATGMSSKQMDSNVELKIYLAAATDPTLDYQANVAALKKLDKLYGTGTTGDKQGGDPPTFETEAEAEASGVEGKVIINGRRATID